MKTPVCPVCGRPLPPEVPFCYDCCRFARGEATDEHLKELLEWSREAEKIRSKQPRAILSRVLGILGLAGLGVGIWMVYHTDIWPALGVLYTSLALLPISGWVAPRGPVLDEKRFHRIGARCIAPGEIRALLGEDVDYDPEACLPEDLIGEAQVYGTIYHDYRGDQLLRCTGFPFEMGYVHLTATQRRFFSKTDVFRGFCLWAKLDHGFPGEIRAIQDYLSCFHPMEGETADFDAMFHGSNLELLTPEQKTAIAQISREGPGGLGLWLRPDGQVFIASNGDWPICREDRPPEQWRTEYRRALAQPLKILHTLL